MGQQLLKFLKCSKRKPFNQVSHRMDGRKQSWLSKRALLLVSRLQSCCSVLYQTLILTNNVRPSLDLVRLMQVALPLRSGTVGRPLLGHSIATLLLSASRGAMEKRSFWRSLETSSYGPLRQ